MEPLKDTWTMTKRSVRHIVRSPDTIITVVLTPIALLLMFVYVLGGALGTQTGSVKYINFITPGIIILTVISGIAYAAFRLNTDIQKGIINRFRTMPIAPSSILGGQAVSSTLSNLLSTSLVLVIAFVAGFRSDAGPIAWLLFAGLVTLFTLATTWMALFFGLKAKSAEGAGSFSYLLMLLIFFSPSFVPTASMTPILRGFAENQPFTPIIETLRSLLTNGTAGGKAWLALGGALAFLPLCIRFHSGNMGKKQSQSIDKGLKPCIQLVDGMSEQNIFEELREASYMHQEWARLLTQLYNPVIGVHLAIMIESFLGFIFSGQKQLNLV